MTLGEFLNTYNGVPNTGDTPGNKGECVGLIEVWIDSLSLPHIWGDAKDLLANADTSVYTVTLKQSGTIPSAGDILVWDQTWGAGRGHTGLVIYATPESVTCFEQNNPAGSAPRLVTHHNYNGVLGWIHIKSVPIDTQSQLTQAVQDRDINWNAFTSVVSYMGITPNPDDKDDMVAQAKAKWDEEKNQLASCQKKNNDYEQAVTSLTSEIKDITDQNASLADLYKKESDKNSQTIQDGTKAINALTKLQNYLTPLLGYFKIKNVDTSDPQKIVEKILDTVTDELHQAQQQIPPPTTEPTVSQTRAAIAVKRKSLFQQIYSVLQKFGVVV